MTRPKPGTSKTLGLRQSAVAPKIDKPAAPADPYRILPPHSAEDIAALKASIERDGVLEKIIIDEHGNVIDGFCRRDICIELCKNWKNHTDIMRGLTEDEKLAMVVSLDKARRTSVATAKQRQKYLDILIIANQGKSQPQIAAIARVSQGTVSRRTTALMQAHKLKPVLKTTDKRGVERAVSSEKRKKPSRITPINGKDADLLLEKLKTKGLELPSGPLISRQVKSAVARKDWQNIEAKALKDFEKLPNMFCVSRNWKVSSFGLA